MATRAFDHDLAPEPGQGVEPCYRQLGRWMWRRRREEGLSLADVAARIGLEPDEVDAIEDGRRRVLLHQAHAIREALAPLACPRFRR